MNRYYRNVLLIFMMSILSLRLQAQDIDIPKVAHELFEYSVHVMNENLPQDLGSMSLDKVSLSEASCNYYYTIKDNSEFSEYRNNKSQVKKNLYLYLDQNLSSMESTLMFCVDANVSIIYHYRNILGSDVVISFSVAELKDILGKKIITSSYRQDVLKRWLPVAFSAATGIPMTYQGMTEKNIMYTLMLEDNIWDDDIVIDQSYMVQMVREEFDNNEPGRFFHLMSIYAEKGEDLTMVNSKTGARKNGVISFYWLQNIYNATHSGNKSYEEISPSSGDIIEEESVPFQLVDTQPKFKGRDVNAFSEWVNTQLVYPKQARDNGVQGRVTLQFTVDLDGSVTNVKIIRGVDPLLDAEALRVVKKSPKWTPGFMRGRKVKVTYMFPVIFTLN